MSEGGYMIVQILNRDRVLEWEAAVPNVILCKRPEGSDTLTLYWGAGMDDVVDVDDSAECPYNAPDWLRKDDLTLG